MDIVPPKLDAPATEPVPPTTGIKALLCFSLNLTHASVSENFCVGHASHRLDPGLKQARYTRIIFVFLRNNWQTGSSVQGGGAARACETARRRARGPP